MVTRTLQCILIAVVIFAFSTTGTQAMGQKTSWQEEFGIEKCNLLTTGRNPYFILEPGYQLVLEGGATKLQITVLDETKTVGGVLTRVGEEEDNYKDGKVADHEGTWRAGTNGSRAGLMMPGTPKVKMKYYQEIAPGVAMDRAEIVSLEETCKTPAGAFSGGMKGKESSAIDLLAKEEKYHAPGIGLVRDEDVRLGPQRRRK